MHTTLPIQLILAGWFEDEEARKEGYSEEPGIRTFVSADKKYLIDILDTEVSMWKHNGNYWNHLSSVPKTDNAVNVVLELNKSIITDREKIENE